MAGLELNYSNIENLCTKASRVMCSATLSWREEIYSRLWPGEMDFEGTNKPYKKQISDHERKLIAQIRNDPAIT